MQQPENSKELNTANSRLVRTCVASALFTICGLISGYLFSSEGGAFFIPGLLFIATTMFVFALSGIQCDFARAGIYIVLMFILYVFVFLAMLLTLQFFVITGIIFFGLGALATFALVNAYIKPFPFSTLTAFTCGAVAFALSNIFLIEPIAALIWPEDPSRNHGSRFPHFEVAYFFWQPIIGITLYVHLTRENKNIPHE